MISYTPIIFSFSRCSVGLLLVGGLITACHKVDALDDSGGPQAPTGVDAGMPLDTDTASGPGDTAGGDGDTGPDWRDDIDPAIDTSPATGWEIPGAEVFLQEALVDYRITMTPEDYQNLEEHGDEEEYLPASLHVVGGSIDETYGQVGFRHKGSWTLHHCWDTGERSYEDECAKLSYKIKFDEYDSEGRLLGLKRLNLHAMSGEGTKVRERLAYDMFNQFGVIAPRTAYARLFVNETLVGLFLMVEQIDGRFTAFRFPTDGDGNLYKEVWPNADVDDESFLEHLKTNNNPEDNPDVSDMRAFAEAVDGSDEETFASVMSGFVNLDNLYRYIAVDRAGKNWDGIMTFYSPYAPHNFYWYREAQENGIFHLVPWDLDNTFWEFDPFMYPEQWVSAEPVPDWNVLPASCEPMSLWEQGGDTRATPPGCDKLINLLAATGWERFAAIGNELLAGPLVHEVMMAKVAAWSREIEGAVREDPYIDYGDWFHQVESLSDILARAVSDFTFHLTTGYTVQEPEEVIPEPDEAVLNAEMTESGLLINIVNNYELIDGAAEEAPKDVFSYGEEHVVEAPFWNTTAPISGNGDLRYEFEFNRQDGPWDEWAGVGLATDDWEAVDIRDLKEISITMMADRNRDVRVRVSSDVYDDVFGDVQSEFGVDFTVTEDITIFKVRLDRLYYPSWAKDDWDEGEGWTTSDREAATLVLSQFTGLIFSVAPNRDSEGEMREAQETGFLQIDNIYFR